MSNSLKLKSISLKLINGAKTFGSSFDIVLFTNLSSSRFRQDAKKSENLFQLILVFFNLFEFSNLPVGIVEIKLLEIDKCFKFLKLSNGFGSDIVLIELSSKFNEITLLCPEILEGKIANFNDLLQKVSILVKSQFPD